MAVGTGTFVGELDGFIGTGDTNDEASASVLAQCNAAGGVGLHGRRVTNDNLCIVSVADDDSDVIMGRRCRSDDRGRGSRRLRSSGGQ